MIYERLTRQQAQDERTALAQALADEHGTADVRRLRNLSRSGRLTHEQLDRIDRLRTLDYLLDDQSPIQKSRRRKSRR